MNRALYIIVIPLLLVAAGYVFVLRAAGLPPGYARLIIAAVVLFGLGLWLGRRPARKGAAKAL